MRGDDEFTTGEGLHVVDCTHWGEIRANPITQNLMQSRLRKCFIKSNRDPARYPYKHPLPHHPHNPINNNPAIPTHPTEIDPRRDILR